MVGGRHVRVVVDRDRVLAEAARRLDQHDDVPELEGGQDDVVPVDVEGAGRLAPRLQHPVPQLAVQLVEPCLIVGEGHARRSGGQLLLRQPFDVVATGVDEPVDQLVAVVGVSSTTYPASRSASSTRTAEAGVSRPTALPTRECLVG